jgi:hypothetical protein
MPADELDGVLGHEIGHAKHGHLWHYLAFLTLSLSVLAAGCLYAGEQLDAAGVKVPAEYAGWLVLPPIVAVFAYLFVVFGFLSRRCERQADVFGCKAVSCGNPNCTGHDEDTVFPHGQWSLCPTGLRTLAEALERVHPLNGFGMPLEALCVLSDIQQTVFDWNGQRRHGYATEGGRAALEFAFRTLHVPRIVSLIRIDNGASERVARRLGGRQATTIDFLGGATLVYVYDPHEADR